MISKFLTKRINTFNQDRKEFYEQFPDFYADFNDGNYQYALYQTFEIKESLEKKIEIATNHLWEIFMKVKDYILTLSKEELQSLNFSPKLIKYIQCDYLTYHSFISRMDFIVDLQTEKIKCIELNNETPFFIVETYQMNNAYLQYKENVKQDDGYLQNIIESFEQVLIDSSHFLKKEQQNLRVAILGCRQEDDIEEYSLMSFYKNLFEQIHEIEFVYYEDLHVVKDEAIYNRNGEQIDVLFHPAYPLEYLQHDTSDKNEPIGLWLLDLVKDEKLALINPPTSHFIQDKTILAFIQTLRELNAPFFTEEDCEFIDEFLAKTYLNSFFLESDNKKYVEKPINGRRGTSISIKENNIVVYKSKDDNLSHEKMIYQEYHEMPIVEVITDGETSYKRLLISAFITKGKYNGLVTVVGDEVIDESCHWLPHLIVK